jgi:hypothetical protein
MLARVLRDVESEQVFENPHCPAYNCSDVITQSLMSALEMNQWIVDLQYSSNEALHLELDRLVQRNQMQFRRDVRMSVFNRFGAQNTLTYDFLFNLIFEMANQ